MSVGQKEEEKIKKMAEFRTLLEKRIYEMGTELEGLQVLLEFVNTALLEKGFRRAEIVKAAPPAKVDSSPVTEYEETVQLKTVTGDLLADLYFGEETVRVVLAEDKEFNINTPPFMAFFVERVLTKMQEKDQEAVSRGEITSDKILSYHITREGDIVREIMIRNVTSDRSRELKSTLRWTLEKMYEKTMENGA